MPASTTDHVAIETVALVDATTSNIHRLREGRTEIGRAVPDGISIDDPTISRRHCAIVLARDGVTLEPLSATNPTFRNGSAIAGVTSLANNDSLVIGERTLRVRFAPPVPDAPPRRPGGDATVVADRANRPTEVTMVGDNDAGEATSTGFERVPIHGTLVIGRDRTETSLRLDHPLVSRVHATVSVANQGATITDNGSANGTFVNGSRIAGPTLLRIGDNVKIGPYLLHFAGDAFTSEPVVSNLELVCRNVSRVVQGSDGQPLTLLDDITLVFRPREFVCIIGPSGSGKSTLLNALAARAPASRGRVELNGLDLYSNFDSLKGDIALVPQKDVVHELLTVESALRYTAKLRLPPDMGPDEREERLDDVLKRVGMTERRSVQIQRLSGGQLKRASLANEILSEPSLLFLDEVTSGLDEHSDGEMMRLFRQVADDGKTVVCITHSLANVAKTASLVVILTRGGKLAFVGTPTEACEYFGVKDLGSVYLAMEAQSPDTWKNRFLADQLHRKYVASRLSAPQVDMGPTHSGGRSWGAATMELVRQFNHLTARYVHLMLSDPKNLLTLAAQPTLVGIILCIVIGRLGTWPWDREIATDTDVLKYANGTTAAFFFLMVACFWFGTNNAAKEIVKERQVYLREQAVVIRPLAYYLSKFVVLGAISLTQVFLLYIGTALVTNLPGSWFLQLITLCQITIVGTSLGLLISATSNSEDRAVTTVPLVLIPQVILSGAIASLSGAGLWLGRLLIACFWAHESLESTVNWPHLTEPSYWPGFLLLTLHLVLFAGAAILVLELGARRLKIRAMLRAAGFQAS